VEHRFREVFNVVRKDSWDAMPSFDINLQRAPAQSFLSAATSWSIIWPAVRKTMQNTTMSKTTVIAISEAGST
jgi:hypothetical protein